MKTFEQFLVENRPEGSFHDRSLEGFRSLLDSLRVQTKGVADPKIKQQLWNLINPFYSQMQEILQNAKSQGGGYSSRYEYQPPVGMMNPNNRTEW